MCRYTHIPTKIIYILLSPSLFSLSLFNMGSLPNNKASSSSSSQYSSPSDISLSSDAMKPAKKTLDQVWTAISLSSLQPCCEKSGPTNRNHELSDESVVLSLNTAGSSQQFQVQNNGGICYEYMSEFPSFSKKRGLEYDGDDYKHKRMMKNRESAARSRARKQAYTNELDIEAKHLREENDGLKMQLEKFCSPTPTEVQKKLKLLRTLSAPV